MSLATTISESQASFQALTARLKDGSDEAFQELLETYSPYVLRSIRRRLHQRLRGRFDSQDFAQAVWMTLHAHRDRIAECETPENLVRFLATVAGRKVRAEFRHNFQTAANNIRRERSLDNDSFVLPLPDHSAEHPSQLLVAAEQLERMLDGEPQKYQEIVKLRCEGLPLKEIGKKVGVTERTVRRVIHQLAAKLED
ncbi:MAG: sigma-70 family RNA polymerase sigma factor [Planctomycetaceae bacterium]